MIKSLHYSYSPLIVVYKIYEICESIHIFTYIPYTLSASKISHRDLSS